MKKLTSGIFAGILGLVTIGAANANIADEEYVKAMTADMATQTWVGNQGYLTEHQSLDGYVQDTDLADAVADALETADVITSEDIDNLNLSQYETITGAEEKYQPKGDYLTEHQSLDGYATTSAVNTAIETAIDGLDIPDTTDMATKTWVGDQRYLTDGALTDYYNKTQVDNALNGKMNTNTDAAGKLVTTNGEGQIVVFTANTGSDGKYVLTADALDGNVTYQWEPITLRVTSGAAGGEPSVE